MKRHTTVLQVIILIRSLNIVTAQRLEVRIKKDFADFRLVSHDLLAAN